MPNHDLLFIGTAATVVAINKSTGKAIWKTELPGSALGSSELTSIAIDESCIYAHTKGELFCLEQNTGKIRWKNELPGLGYKSCIIAVPGMLNSLQEHAAAINAIRQNQHTSDAGHTTG